MRTTQRWMATTTLALLAALTLQAQAACTFGRSNEMSLQGVFDSVLGARSLSATGDCVAASSDTLWTAEGRAVATIIIEIAGFASGNVLGLYDPAHPKRQVSIFEGADSSGSTVSLELRPNGSGYDVLTNDAVEGHFASSVFGFFLHTPQNETFFSQPTLNPDRADHMYAYAGNGGLFTGGPLNGTAFATSMYLLAFEDLRIPGGDADFQDFVATVNFIAPIPLPAAAPLLGAALALLTIWRRRAVANSTSN